MPKKRISFISVLLILAIALFPNTIAAEPILVLVPSLGDTPSVSGDITGSGWLCDSGIAPTGSATVSGLGLAGSATINRDGSLSGSFTVRGDAGQIIRVTVTSSASCPSGRTQTNLAAYAIFTFNTPTPIPTSTTPPPLPTTTQTPFPTATAAPLLTATPTPQPTVTTMRMPTATPTPAPSISPAGPPKPLITAAPAMIDFIGCSPSNGKVQVKFDPVNAMPGVQTFTVPAVQVAGQQGSFAMDVSQAWAGTVYKVLVLTDDPGCTNSLNSKPQAYWLGGRKLNISFVKAGKTELWSNPSGIANGDMLAWMKEVTIEGYEKSKHVPFKIETELKGVQAIKVQASYFPMPTDLSTDPMAPPGLLATWDIKDTCATCTFTVDISNLLPPQPQVKKSFLQTGMDSIITFFGGIGNGAKNTMQSVSNMLQGGKNSNEVVTTQVTPSPQTTTNLGNYVKSKVDVALPTTFYFRAVLLDKDGKPAGNPSNSVKITWTAEASTGGIDFKIPTPPPGKPYANWNVEFISYHGILKPKKDDGCFIVTENSIGYYASNHYHAPGDPSHKNPYDNPYSPFDSKSAYESYFNYEWSHHQYFKDDIICQPDPPEGCGWSDPGTCVSDIANFFEDAINWVSKAYNSAKNTAVGFAADGLGVIPGLSDICSKSCLKAGLSMGMDAALTSMGVPPNIPNFAELEDQGLDYLAEQAVANSQIPQGALDAAKTAGIDPKEEIKKGIKKGLVETQKSYANSFDWLPDGVPVRPDGIQPSVVTLKVTRNKNDPTGDCNGGSVSVNAFATMSGDFPGYHPYHPSNLPISVDALDIKAGGTYRVFEPKSVSLPCAAPGTSLVIPVVLDPYFPHVGTNPPDTGYFWWLYPYAKSGELRVQASGSNEVKFNFVPYDPKW